MRLRLSAAILLAVALSLLPAGSGSGAPPSHVTVPTGFFGIAPQTAPGEADFRYMSAGGIESVRVPVAWSEVQPTANGGYHWEGLDQTVALAARSGVRVLPFFYYTPSWVAAKPTTLPVRNAKQRSAWRKLLTAAVQRYGPGGTFWTEHATERRVEGTEGVYYEEALPRQLPIRTWQIWNEVNFFYFAYPVSPGLYAQLVKLSSQAIKAADPGAQVVLSGLFGKPGAKGLRGMPAATFLERLYRVPGIKSYFDGVSLHPYAVDTEVLEEMVEGIHEVIVANHDRVGLYITEMGWGSQNDFRQVAFEQGPAGQARELRGAYGFLIENQRRLALRQVYWFSWKDAPGSCNFCDSVGLFHAGARFKPKPAWRAFVSLTGGRLRP